MRTAVALTGVEPSVFEGVHGVQHTQVYQCEAVCNWWNTQHTGGHTLKQIEDMNRRDTALLVRMY